MFFNNAMPINIKRGTQVAFYNTDPTKTEQQNFIFRYTIDRDVDPNDTFFLEQLLTDIEVTDDLRFRLENFQTDGSRRPVTFDSEAVIDFTFTLVFLKLNSVIIKAPESYTVSDESDWNFNDGEEAKGKAEGDLNFWLTNSLPVEFEVQFYLEDDAGNVLDSIFAERVDLPGAPYNSTIDEVVGEIDTSYLFILSDDRIDMLTQATKLRTEFFVATPTEDVNGIPLQSLNITMKETSSLDIQVVADVKVDVNAAIEDN